MSNQITPFNSIVAQIQHEITVDADGNGFISRRGLARLLGVSNSTYMQGGRNLSVELLETLAQYGLEPAQIFAEGSAIPDSAVGIIAR